MSSIKRKYMGNPDYIINCYIQGKLVKDIEIQMDEETFKNQIKEGILKYLDVNSGEVGIINLNQFDYYDIKDLRIEEKKIPEKLSNIKFENGKFYLPVGNKHNYIIREVDKVFLDKINEIIDYLKNKGE